MVASTLRKKQTHEQSGAKNLKIKLNKQGSMLSFPTQNDKKNFFVVYSKKQTRVTANQHVFKSDLNQIFL